jgi:protocatechuate 4,5-dioxygenase alpha chain
MPSIFEKEIVIFGRSLMSASHEIFGTTPFDGAMAQRGYTLNKMCFSFNSAANREAFRKDEDAYMRAYGLNDSQAAAIRKRDVLGLLEAGGNVYYLAKFAGILGLDMQDLGAAQTGMTKDAFKARLVAQNEQPETL